VRRRRGPQFREIENLSLRGCLLSASASPSFKSGLNDFGRPSFSLRFCQFISMCEKDTDYTIMYFDLGLVYLHYLIFVSLPFEDIPRPRGSLFETVISSYRHSLHLQSTLTGNPLKNSYRSSPQLCFLLLNLNSSRILFGLCRMMRYCIIFCQVGRLFRDLNAL
jgi:hypothetical protein